MTVYTYGGTVDPVKENNDVPLVVGAIYNITPGEASSQWVRIIKIEKGYVHTEGVGNTIADWVVPTWKFDDLVKQHRLSPAHVAGVLLDTGDGQVLGTEEEEGLSFD